VPSQAADFEAYTMPRFAKLQDLATIEEVNEILSGFIRARFKGQGAISILEAGCGNKWALDLAGLEYSLTGIDIDKNGLELRQKLQNDLNVAIHGDLCSVEMEESQFDVVYSSYVLEHVDGAELALENFLRWLKPGGFMLLKFPDRDSVFGFITRTVPFWIHVLYKKYIFKLPNAGEPGHGPFPTVYDRVVSRRGMYEFCAAHELKILHEYSTNYYLKRLGGLVLFVNPLLQLIQLVSLQKLKADHNNLVFIIEKPTERQV
jgi:SAM-dependent methyltransferase